MEEEVAGNKMMLGHAATYYVLIIDRRLIVATAAAAIGGAPSLCNSTKINDATHPLTKESKIAKIVTV